MQYKATIGLEIHAELRTKTKMFCNSKNDPDEIQPNINICPICLAHPGTLPVINREAVMHVLRVGAALGATLADYTEFDRKNYFYPDLPRGYQISQYEFPLISHGELAGVKITRVHLEEDTASSLHDEITGETLIDFNRAGVPLMELVTEPVITNAEQAGSFARELQLLLRYLGASDANMEKGEMRVEANISVAPDIAGTADRNADGRRLMLGTKVEVKNLNSFRAMERAVEYEIKRQTALLEKGGKVLQETRGWDDAKQATFAQRLKEGSADYRYFPDPDLPSLKLSELVGSDTGSITKALPELPDNRRQRYIALGLKKADAEAFVRDGRLGEFFEEVIAGFKGDSKRIILASNYIANDLVKLMRDTEGRDAQIRRISLSSLNFQKLINLIASGRISSRSAKDILTAIAESDTDPEQFAHERSLFLSELDMGPLVDRLMKGHAEVVAEYRAGKANVLEYLVGQGMKAMKGKGNPAALRDELLKQLGR